jgi:hypothetical protein
MEYVVISYATTRNVRIDGQLAGKTNDTLMVERGHHVFDLGEPEDYQPKRVEKNVPRTTVVMPFFINDFRPA